MISLPLCSEEILKQLDRPPIQCAGYATLAAQRPGLTPFYNRVPPSSNRKQSSGRMLR
jgi:hypothetical protein